MTKRRTSASMSRRCEISDRPDWDLAVSNPSKAPFDPLRLLPPPPMIPGPLTTHYVPNPNPPNSTCITYMPV